MPGFENGRGLPGADGCFRCQVRPLYSDAAPNSAGVTSNAALNSIAVAEAKDRVTQEVRNHLIFALSGGAGNRQVRPIRWTSALASR